MFKVGLINDKIEDNNNLKDLIVAFEQEYNCPLIIEIISNSFSFVNVNSFNFDILFINTNLQYINGIELSQSIRKVNSHVEIILVSNSRFYAVDGYKVKAFDYLLNPINYETLASTLSRCLFELQRRDKDFAIFNYDGELVKFFINDIVYCESSDHDFYLVLEEKRFKIKCTLKSFYKQYGKYGFSFCNSCYLVNLRHVRSISGDIVKVGANNFSLEISRRKKAQFKADFLNFITL